VSRTNLNEVSKAGGRTAASASSNRIRSVLVMSEIGLATVALIGAGLSSEVCGPRSGWISD
jgi:hypothetical protein